MSVPLCVGPPVHAAVICAVDDAATGTPVTVNVVEVLPDGIVTVLTDTVATAELSLATFTVTPPVGAVVFNVTVAVDVNPPTMLVGLSATELIVGGFNVSAAVCCTPFKVAEMLDTVCAPTLDVVTVNVAEVALAGTVTVASTLVAVESSANVTTTPPAGKVWAGPFSVTVAVGFVEPPCTVVALRERVATPVAAGVTVTVLL